MFAFSPPLKVEQFAYDLPSHKIAQIPATPRDAARLLVSHNDKIVDRHVHDLPEELRPGDLLVCNDTRVIPARLLGHRPSGGAMEIFLLHPLNHDGTWEALVKSNKRIVPGTQVTIAHNFFVTIQDRTEKAFQVSLHHPGETLEKTLETYGRIPLPPYITERQGRDDHEHYQTVFARHRGAVAAPTAGLHFTRELFQKLAEKKIAVAWVTLHVGLGTFQPLRAGPLSGQRLHAEWCQLPAETVQAIHTARTQGGRVVAVGTTVVRTLESAAHHANPLCPWQGETDLFIQPGHEFKICSGMITNFHLPKSSLLMLVGALIGLDRLKRDYVHALEGDYRFFSYGDASLLWP
ncbi:MAG: tRNA preQ1(34) S-adenosylmethionine ribosyltransferase-isomerase QueA [Magnetococcales bacterium]|nr:tRNA preQ1(34) S-adenosylmethionine ribosyltransferase-isomerase QueA [Magnetococcales bacterium]